MNGRLRFLLDTNVCIQYLNSPDSLVRQRLANVRSDEIAVCSVVKAELFYGSKRSKNPARNLEVQMSFLDQFESLSFDDAAAVQYGDIRADLESIGMVIGPYDLQIAAIAKANYLTLVTHNTREFARVSGLSIEDWEI